MRYKTNMTNMKVILMRIQKLQRGTKSKNFQLKTSEGFKMSIAHPLDQPTMQVNELDISPGFETQVAVTPTLYTTTDAAMKRFRPEQRGCYNQDELMLHYLPRRMYRFNLQLDNCLM